MERHPHVLRLAETSLFANDVLRITVDGETAFRYVPGETSLAFHWLAEDRPGIVTTLGPRAVTVVDERTLELIIPAALAPGRYALEILSGADSATAADALRLLPGTHSEAGAAIRIPIPSRYRPLFGATPTTVTVDLLPETPSRYRSFLFKFGQASGLNKLIVPDLDAGIGGMLAAGLPRIYPQIVPESREGACRCSLRIVPFSPGMTPPQVSECLGNLRYPPSLTSDRLRVVYELTVEGECEPTAGELVVFHQGNAIRRQTFRPMSGTHECDPPWDLKNDAGFFVQSRDRQMHGQQAGIYDIVLEVTLSDGTKCASAPYEVRVFSPDRVTEHYRLWWREKQREHVEFARRDPSAAREQTEPLMDFAELLYRVSSEIDELIQGYVELGLRHINDPCWLACLHQELYERWRLGVFFITPEEMAEYRRGNTPQSLLERLRRHARLAPTPGGGVFEWQDAIAHGAGIGKLNALAQAHDVIDMEQAIRQCGCGDPSAWNLIIDRIAGHWTSMRRPHWSLQIAEFFMRRHATLLLDTAKQRAGCP